MKGHEVENKGVSQELQKDTEQNTIIQTLLSQYYPTSLLQNSRSRLSKNHKSKSISSLPSILKNPLTVKGSLSKRYNLHQGGLKQEIVQLEKGCDQFGGSQYIKDEMKKQKISRQQQLEYYDKRIRKLNSNHSLPKLLQYKEIQGSSKLKLLSQERSKEVKKKSQDKQQIPYNKWYMKPTERFSKIQTILNKSTHGKMKANEEKDYIQDLLLTKNKKKNVQVKGQYAPKIIKESMKKLGRQPIICSYAKISRM